MESGGKDGVTTKRPWDTEEEALRSTREIPRKRRIHISLALYANKGDYRIGLGSHRKWNANVGNEEFGGMKKAINSRTFNTL